MRKLTFLIAIVVSLGVSGSALGQSQATPMMSGTEIHQLNLETGELMSLGTIGNGVTVVAFALDTSAEVAGPAWAVTAEGDLITFDATSPEDITSSMPVSGLEDGDWLVGIDMRPATGEVVGISAWSVLYSIDPSTGEATALGETLDPALEADTLGFDFNPTVDRIRVDVSTTQNLRLNPETGAVGTNPDTGAPTIDGNTAFAEADTSAGVTPMVVAAGYTNSVAAAEETVLYVIDAETNALAIQDPPNDGTLNTVAALSVPVNAYTGLDIAPTGEAFVTIPAWDDSMATPAS